MADFLFVVPPLTGHINPTVSVAHELTERGHSVAWVGYPKATRALLPEGAELVALDDDVPDALLAQIAEKSATVRGLASLKFLWEDFLVPLARGMRDGVEAAVRERRPDLLVVDHQALAGAMVARRLGTPWATSATTSAGVVSNPVGALAKVWEWVLSQMAELEREAELEPMARPDLSPRLVLVFSAPELIGEDEFPSSFRFVGPSLSARQKPIEFPWNELRPGPRVLVSLGTVSGARSEKFYQVVAEGLGGAPFQVILVAPHGMLAQIPDNFLVRDYVPQLELLPKMNAVVSHAGHNTVCETLAHGLPLVVTPIRDDQPVVAGQVAGSGAGLRLSFGRLTPGQLRQAVDRVLGENEFAQAAARIRSAFAAAGGAPQAARYLQRCIDQGA